VIPARIQLTGLFVHTSCFGSRNRSKRWGRPTFWTHLATFTVLPHKVVSWYHGHTNIEYTYSNIVQ